MRTIIGAVARYFTGRPLLSAFIAIGAADIAHSAARIALSLSA